MVPPARRASARPVGVGQDGFSYSSTRAAAPVYALTVKTSKLQETDNATQKTRISKARRGHLADADRDAAADVPRKGPPLAKPEYLKGSAAELFAEYAEL